MSITSRPHESDDLAPTLRNSVREQALMREVNEQVSAFAAASAPGDVLLVTCECTTLSCALPLSLARSDYERVRRHPARFVVRRGHAEEIGERVVEESAEFAVVEKLGEAAEIATRLDPRRTLG